MIPEKLMQVLKHEGVVAIATQGEGEPHLVNSWNSYLHFTEVNSLLIPAGFMHKTESNVAKNNKVAITLGCKDVEGFRGPGTGFLIKGTASFKTEGTEFEITQQRFPWVRAVLEIKIDSITQTL